MSFFQNVMFWGFFVKGIACGTSSMQGILSVELKASPWWTNWSYYMPSSCPSAEKYSAMSLGVLFWYLIWQALLNSDGLPFDKGSLGKILVNNEYGVSAVYLEMAAMHLFQSHLETPAALMDGCCLCMTSSSSASHSLLLFHGLVHFRAVRRQGPPDVWVQQQQQVPINPTMVMNDGKNSSPLWGRLHIVPCCKESRRS